MRGKLTRVGYGVLIPPQEAVRPSFSPSTLLGRGGEAHSWKYPVYYQGVRRYTGRYADNRFCAGRVVAGARLLVPGGLRPPLVDTVCTALGGLHPVPDNTVCPVLGEPWPNWRSRRCLMGHCYPV